MAAMTLGALVKFRDAAYDDKSIYRVIAFGEDGMLQLRGPNPRAVWETAPEYLFLYDQQARFIIGDKVTVGGAKKTYIVTATTTKRTFNHDTLGYEYNHLVTLGKAWLVHENECELVVEKPETKPKKNNKRKAKAQSVEEMEESKEEPHAEEAPQGPQEAPQGPHDINSVYFPDPPSDPPCADQFYLTGIPN